MSWVVSAGLLVAGVIHLLPVPGLFGATSLKRLYGISVADPDLLVMMRHRALLFGLLGALLIAAAFVPSWRIAGIVAGLLSAAGFVIIAWQTGSYSASIARVVKADTIAVASLFVAAVAMWMG